MSNIGLVVDSQDPALRAKKIKGAEDLWEARASRPLRMTFRIEGDTAILRNIGHHNETLERP